MRVKKGAVFSLQLRNGKYALMQIIDSKKRVAIFNEFRAVDDWKDFVLTKDKILFMNVIGRFFYKKSILNLHKITPLSDNEILYPNTVISSGSSFNEIVIWKGAPNEIELTIIGKSDDLMLDTFDTETMSYSYQKITVNDYDYVKHYEMSNLQIWPHINERLNIISELNLNYNYDPSRELAFGRELDPICKVWVDINMGNKEAYGIPFNL